MLVPVNRFWSCSVGSCWRGHSAVVALNTIFFTVRQLPTQNEFSSCQSTLSTCMLILILVKIHTYFLLDLTEVNLLNHLWLTSVFSFDVLMILTDLLLMTL